MNIKFSRDWVGDSANSAFVEVDCINSDSVPKNGRVAQSNFFMDKRSLVDVANGKWKNQDKMFNDNCKHGGFSSKVNGDQAEKQKLVSGASRKVQFKEKDTISKYRYSSPIVPLTGNGNLLLNNEEFSCSDIDLGSDGNGSFSSEENVVAQHQQFPKLSEEVAKVIKTGVALGFNFHGKKELATVEISKKEKEDEAIFLAGIGVEASGSMGGVVTLWNDEFFKARSCIHNNWCVIVASVLSKIKKDVVFYNLYAANEEHERVQLWNFILDAQVSLPGSWVIGEDFNIVIVHIERTGGIGSVRSIRNFKLFANMASVFDIPMNGLFFTWHNNREIRYWARLDHFLCNPLFISWFAILIQKCLDRSLFDHNPVIIGEHEVDWGPKPFHFFIGWLEDKKLMEGARSSWAKCVGVGSVGSKIMLRVKAVKHYFKFYFKNRKVEGNKIKFLEKELTEIEKKAVVQGWVEVLRKERSECLVKLWKQIRMKEQKWKRASRFRWLKDGDRNSKYFYVCSNVRRKTNFIDDLTILCVRCCGSSEVRKGVFPFLKIISRRSLGSDQILDSFVIAEEVIHSWKRDEKGGFIVKLDFEKAYDSFDHDFLIEVLANMGFGVRWQEWIRWCIASPSMSVLVNGYPMKQFPVGRGLRQGFNEVDSSSIFRCASASLPVTYLGLPLGENSSKEVFWRSVISKVEQRLTLWKRSFLPKSVRLVLIKVAVCSGEHVRLWQDIHCDNIPLKCAFSRILALANNKEDLNERCMDAPKVKAARCSSWLPPADMDLYFNVDGSIYVSTRDAGIGRVLRDSRGKVLCLFSFFMGIMDSDSAEVYDIHRACQLLASN
ncbi:hypothetical protein Ddye_032232 [Dipteronia dyeriana]|uniref:Reverse transcriptase domain-containing protein n=1 Tax=Dipteronia dyeriana TaxID=168575 RepID=A0AAD9WPF1_9ROSI|nr:hypothetical protein Ddye_032232 [Dipteronia dyeriana]